MSKETVYKNIVCFCIQFLKFAIVNTFDLLQLITILSKIPITNKIPAT